MAKAPQSINRVQSRLQELRKPVEQVTRTAEQVEAATEVSKSGPQEVVVRGPRLSERLLGNTQSLLTGTMETIILLYFLLAAGDLFLQKLIKVLPQLKDKKKAVTIARETEASISTYVHGRRRQRRVGRGGDAGDAADQDAERRAVGALAALAEFIPYLGATAMLATLAMAGLITFPDVGHALLVPGAYPAVNLLQANFITPAVLGRRLTLNPVAILIGLVFWWWIWGVGGAFIAVPLLATFKIFCDHIESLAPIGEFLGNRASGADGGPADLTESDCLGSPPTRVDCARVRLHRASRRGLPGLARRGCCGSAAAAPWRSATTSSCPTAARAISRSSRTSSPTAASTRHGGRGATSPAARSRSFASWPIAPSAWARVRTSIDWSTAAVRGVRDGATGADRRRLVPGRSRCPRRLAIPPPPDLG